jgi:hypothetical protein
MAKGRWIKVKVEILRRSDGNARTNFDFKRRIKSKGRMDVKGRMKLSIKGKIEFKAK